ncbi:class I SAM-dependent methyltransferase [Lysinibacillus sp. NPDC097195]|uniref:class I SAM-dependent methyltransferase n=1 Tax=Lysinibacillus sp. NPDC097195 TaxID=3364141 RepID=UPI0037F27410
MFVIPNSKYLDFLAEFGVSGAHPGGLALTKELLKHEHIDNKLKILDVGCGTGQTAAYLASKYQAHVTAIDNNAIMVAKAKNRMAKHRLPMQIIQASLEHMPLANKQFDLIISESVLSFVKNKPQALDEIYRVLQDGGKLIAIEFTIKQLLDTKSTEDIKQFYGFDSLFMKKDWVALFKNAGFQTIRIRKNKSISSAPEFNVSQHIEPALYQVMDQHIAMNNKYDGILDYRIYDCTK